MRDYLGPIVIERHQRTVGTNPIFADDGCTVTGQAKFFVRQRSKREVNFQMVVFDSLPL